MFKNDKDMPLFSTFEGDAAARYLDVAIDVADARKAGRREVAIHGEIMTLQQAERLRQAYFREFMDVVRKETFSQNKDAGDNVIRLRAHDILSCLSDTSYVRDGH